jgi:hypothetical protein
MKKLIICLFLLIVTSCTSNQNNMRDFTYAGNLPVVRDTINNEVVHFIIDSGAGLSLINTEYYVNNKDLFRTLEEVEMMLFGISGVADYKTSHTVRLKTSLGYYTFQDSDLSPVIKKANSYGYNVVGLIGSDILKDDYVINYKTKQLIHATE